MRLSGLWQTGPLLAALLVARAAMPDATEPSLPRAFIAYDEPSLALVGVDVLDGSGSALRRAQTLLLRDGRIESVGQVDAVSVPEGARVLHLPGHTVIPGLVGMHDHTHMPGVAFLGETAARLWLASGVTTVQTAGSAEPQKELALADSIQHGRLAGPAVFPTAHYINGPGGNGPMTQPASEAEARELVRR